MKKGLYQKLKKYSNLLENKELYPLINDIINEYKVTDLNQERNQNKIILSCHNREKISLEIVENKLIFTNCIKNTIVQKDIIFPNTHSVQSISIEKRPQGLIITKIDKKYNVPAFSTTEKTITNLESVISVYKNTTLQRIIPKIDSQNEEIHHIFQILIGTNEQIVYLGNHIDFLGVAPNMTTYLEICNRVLVGYDACLADDTSYSKSNQVDISKIYDSVSGKDRIARIYDLYHGIITERNKQDIQAIDSELLTRNAFDLKTKIGITSKIEQLVGPAIIPSKTQIESPTSTSKQFIKKLSNSSSKKET